MRQGTEEAERELGYLEELLALWRGDLAEPPRAARPGLRYLRLVDDSALLAGHGVSAARGEWGVRRR
ncbi:MAG TPA: hypothetical protein VF121_19840 [Thermoanaerobaculia bacterium]|nr:hypothetical protein [Thermoanaerobaculia bacterium]